MNKLLRTILVCCFLMMAWCFRASALADSTMPDPSPVSLNINGKMDADLAVLVWPDGSVSYPAKALASVLDADPHQANLTHDLSLTPAQTEDTVQIMLPEQQVTRNGVVLPLSGHPIVLCPNAVFTQDELFISQEMAERVFGIALSYDAVNQAIQMRVPYSIKVLVQAEREANEGAPVLKRAANDEQDAVFPDKRTQLLETLGINLHSSSYQLIQSLPQLSAGDGGGQYKLLTHLTSLTTEWQGHVGTLPYTFKPTWIYRNGAVGLQNIEGALRWETPKRTVRLGVTKLGLSPLISPRLEVWGLAANTPNAAEGVPQSLPVTQIAGDVADSDNPVQIRLDGRVVETQTPQNGRYQFDNIPLQRDHENHLEVVQLDTAGNPQVLQRRQVSNYQGFLAAGEKAVSSFLGRAPLQFNPYVGTSSSGGDNPKGLFLDQSNKWLAGGRYYYGVTDRLTAGVSFSADSILGEAKTNPLYAYLQTLQAPNLSGYTSFIRDSNLVSGINMGMGLSYRLGHGFSLAFDGGVSRIRHFGDSPLKLDNPFGLAGQMAINYQAPHFSSSLNLFHYGTEYYTPASQGISNLYDRQGIGLKFQGERWGIHYQVDAARNRTNLSSLLAGGPIWVNTWQASGSRHFKTNTDIDLFLSGIHGTSEAGSLDNRNNMLFLSQQLPWGILLNGGVTRTSNQQVFNPLGFGDNTLLPVVSFGTAQTYYNASVQTPLPWQVGNLSISATLGGSYSFGEIRTNCRWRRLLFQPEYRVSLGGDYHFFNIGAGLYYETLHGSRFGVRYLYSLTNTAVSGSSGAQSANQTLTFELQDMATLTGRHLSWVGSQGRSTGLVRCLTYLDRNQNNRRDKGEPVLGNIPLRLDGELPIGTNRRGVTYLVNLSPRLHTIDYDYDNLPFTLSPVSPAVKVKVMGGRQNRVELGLSMTIGTLSGTVFLKDGNGNALDPTDTVVRLRDITNNKFIKYTFTDKEGHYTLSEVPPGTYEIVVDSDQVKTDFLKVLSTPEKVVVPLDFKQFYEKKQLDFQLLKVFS